MTPKERNRIAASWLARAVETLAAPGADLALELAKAGDPDSMATAEKLLTDFERRKWISRAAFEPWQPSLKAWLAFGGGAGLGAPWAKVEASARMRGVFYCWVRGHEWCEALARLYPERRERLEATRLIRPRKKK